MPRPLLRRPWSPEDDVTLADLFQRGKSPILIAAKLKRTVGAVVSRRHVLMGRRRASKATGFARVESSEAAAAAVFGL